MLSKVFEYNGNQISVIKKDGGIMINATQMARPFGKQPRDFLKTERIQQFVKAISIKQKCLIKDIVRTEGKGKDSVTWMHEKLALKFAEYLSIDFELWVNDVIESVLKTGSYSLGSIDKFLLDLPCQWEKTFPDQFFNNLRKLYGLPYMDDSHTNPQYFGKFILEYIYKPLGKDLPDAIKAKRTLLTEENAEQYLHQFLNSDARQVLMTQIVKVNAVMHLSSSIVSFKETWTERFLNENQLELYLR